MSITAKRAISGPAIVAGLGGGNAVGTNVAAVGATLTNSLSTGNATNPNFVIRVGVKTGSGAAQATATTALTIVGETLAAQFAGAVSAPSLALSGATIGSNVLAFAGATGFIDSTGNIAVPNNKGYFGTTSGGVAQRLFVFDASNISNFGDFTGSYATKIGGTTVNIITNGTTTLGAAAVDTAPVAQTLSVQNTLAGGTSNVAGANFTIAGSQGKGTGVGGSLIFQTAPAGSTGTTVNALATVLTLNTTAVVVASGKNFQLGNSATTGLIAGALAALTTASIVIYDSTGTAYRVPCITP